MENPTLEDILDKAIVQEENAFSFYTDFIDKVRDTASKSTLGFLAQEERLHKEILLQYKQGEFKEEALDLKKPVDMRVAETFDIPDVAADMNHKDIFLIAARREKASHEFYTGLARLHKTGTLKKLFLKLADEELKHKEKVEYLYCNAAFCQTDGG